jgi:hypothetical protein
MPHPLNSILPTGRRWIRTTNCIPCKKASCSRLQLSSNPEPTALVPEQMDRNGETVHVPQLFNLDDDDDSHQTMIPNAQQQLWLDLRGTALFPNEALLFLQEQCSSGKRGGRDDDDSNSMLCKYVDAVLVSSTQFDAILAANSSSADIGCDYKLLYTTANEKKDLILNIPETQQSLKVGRIVACHPERPNLIAAHDMVLQQHQWILLEEENKSSAASATSVPPWMLKQAADLLQFLFTSDAGLATEDFAVSDSGLLLPDTTTTTRAKTPSAADPAKDEPNFGGVAMLCTDRASLFQMDATVTEYRHFSRGTRTTSSGWILPKDAGAVPEDVPSFGTALVLPLDVSLWETALNVRIMNDDTFL